MTAAPLVRIEVVYATPARQVWLDLDVPAGTTVRRAIELSGILMQCPEIDLDTQKVGIHASIVKPDKVVEAGNRIEIYRPITADPKKVPRRSGGSA